MADLITPMKERAIAVDVIVGDAREKVAALPSGSIDCVITDPVWPNAPDGMFLVENPWALLNDTLYALPVGVKRIAIIMRSDSDPRFLSAVPAYRWPFFHMAWMQYALPSRVGRKLGGNEVVYCFGEPPQPRAGRHLIPGMCSVKAQPACRGNPHPCPRSQIHMEWLVDCWSEPGETILDPFAGSGTVGLAAINAVPQRSAILIEINTEYAEMARQRIRLANPLFAA